MKVTVGKIACMVAITGLLFRCNDQGLNSDSIETSQDVSLIDIAQTSGQLASGTSFQISGSSTDSTGIHPGGHGHGKQGPRGPKGIVDGLHMLAPTDEILAIIDAESASDIRGLRISKNGGATITHFNAAGAQVTLSLPANGPQGCSFSGKQFPEYDSLLGTIVRTVIDFGTGVTFKRDTVTITRAGKITIERSGNAAHHSETTTFDSYSVNGIKIQGIKTRVSSFDSATGSGSSATTVSNGKFTFADGTEAAWESEKSRSSEIVLNATTHRPESGKITTEVNTTITASDGTVIYEHKTVQPLIEDVACAGRRNAPVSGVLETKYRENQIAINFGDGTCENRSVEVTINGVVTTKTIGR